MYCIGGYFLATATSLRDISFSTSVFLLALYGLGWVFTRGPNMQKYYFKTNPHSATCFSGLVRQETIPASRILCSGFWGLSRHINYLGEIVQALALALPATLSITDRGYALIPLAYPLYYVLLFVGREREDQEVCRRKYGAQWLEYEKRVPWRIVPYLY
ncbi:hypothetical protein HDU91_006819 [Kappamyces sp. JEL0680]|nr:hypothetical protein HDU91_006819 [Kappamyces sp. JEL0680]